MAKKRPAEDSPPPEVPPRPVTLSGFFGHPRQLGILGRAMARGALNPSLLFAGPQGVGKATLALRLAAALQCAAPSPWACGRCPACRKVSLGLHPDLREIRQGLNEETGKPKRDIVVDQVREDILAPLGLPPYEGRKLVFLLDPAEALNANAQNALLKSLEEPPAYAQFLLVTANPAALLPTVRSRCQVVTFGPLPDKTMREASLAAGVPGATAIEALHAAAGSPGPLFSGEWKESAKRRKSLLALLGGGLQPQAYPALAPQVEALSLAPPRPVLQDALRVVSEARRALVAGRGELLPAAEARGGQGLQTLADRLGESLAHLERNVNLRLLLERAFLVP